MLNLAEEYRSFRASVPLRKICFSLTNDPDQTWSFYEAGPKSVKCPLLFLPPVSGGADVYFRQILNLSARGFRVMAVDYPCYWDVDAFCTDFYEFLNYNGFDKVHLFGASLGGFLAQKFAEFCVSCQRVASLILCNSFTDTAIFNRQHLSLFYWALPTFVLKQIILAGFRTENDLAILRSTEFMIDRLDTLTQKQLASRMTLNCSKSKCKTNKLTSLPITLIDVFDNSALSEGAKDLMVRFYPHAKRAHFKSGGNFPFLSRSDELNMHVMVHLQKFNGSIWSAREMGENESYFEKASKKSSWNPLTNQKVDSFSLKPLI